MGRLRVGIAVIAMIALAGWSCASTKGAQTGVEQEPPQADSEAAGAAAEGEAAEGAAAEPAETAATPSTPAAEAPAAAAPAETEQAPAEAAAPAAESTPTGGEPASAEPPAAAGQETPPADTAPGRAAMPAAEGPDVPESPAGMFGEPLPKPRVTESFFINYEDADIREVIHQFATDILGIDVIVGKSVTGSITIYSSEEIKPEQAWDVFLSLLEMNNLSVARSGRYYKILPTTEAGKKMSEIGVGGRPEDVADQDIVVTQIVPLRYVTPQEVATLLGTMKSATGTVAAHGGTNILIVTDYKSIVRRMLKILQIIDVDTSQRELEVIRIKYASVKDIADTLNKILEGGKGAGGQAGQLPAIPREGTPDAEAVRIAADELVVRAVGQGAAKPIIIPDERSSLLIIFANRREIEFIRKIIEILDVDIYVSERTYVYYVENAEAAKLATTLGQLYGGGAATAKDQKAPTSRQQQEKEDRTYRGPQSPEAPQPQPEPQPEPPAPRSPNVGEVSLSGSVQGDVKLVADERTNSLVIVTSPVNWPYVLETIKKLDIFPRQVLVEVLIAEVALDDSWQFGVTWQLKSQGNVNVDGEDYYFDTDARLNGSASPTAAGFTYGVFEATRFQGLLNAFANDAKLNVLSSPQIMASNNTEASIEVADEVPIPVSVYSSGTGGGTPSTTPINTSIQYRDTGVILKVKPRITESQFVTLEVAQEVSEQGATSNIGGTEAPTIQKRKAQTSVAMRADETLIIGGLIRSASRSGSGGIPWLQRIPILGRLFSSKSVSNRRTELIIMITPHIVDEVSGPKLTEAAREHVPAVDKLIQRPQKRKWWRP